ncbi:MAG: DUF4159 domain-containing protein [Deltaproteobacteria bacterium]|nr:DUF4159 domain-containing protein [Deltaproteobacteria bacterium]
MNRREFIKSLFAIPLVPDMLALLDYSKFTAAKVKYNGNWNLRENALRRIMYEVNRRTSISCSREPATIEPSDTAIFNYPFLSVSGDSALPEFSTVSIARLRRFINKGGFIFADSSEEKKDEFYKSVVKLAGQIIPGTEFVTLDEKNVIYRTFYMLTKSYGRFNKKDFFEGIIYENRIVILFSHNDLLGALERDELGNYKYSIPDENIRRELSIRTAVNIVMYSLTVDYKDDQVHHPFFKEKTRR